MGETARVRRKSVAGVEESEGVATRCPSSQFFCFLVIDPKTVSFSHFRAAIKKMGGGEVVTVRRARQSWPQRRRSISSVKYMRKLVWVPITPTCASVRRRSLADHQSAISLLSEGPRSPNLHLTGN